MRRTNVVDLPAPAPAITEVEGVSLKIIFHCAALGWAYAGSSRATSAFTRFFNSALNGRRQSSNRCSSMFGGRCSVLRESRISRTCRPSSSPSSLPSLYP
ncbi:hypothetical protein D3C72_2039650 [compost metagenome]